jgi:hypothetical protein
MGDALSGTERWPVDPGSLISRSAAARRARSRLCRPGGPPAGAREHSPLWHVGSIARIFLLAGRDGWVTQQMRQRGSCILALGVGILFAIGAGCGHTADGPRAARHPAVPPRDTRIVHEVCELTAPNAVREDINGDGRPDRTLVTDASGASCNGLDFNFDGVIDAWVYLDATGASRRRENDYDRDGQVDEVSLYTRGGLTEQQRSTVLAGKVDTWQYYRSGKLTRTERDSNGDDYVDQWWEYPTGRSVECPLIHSDVDGDGRPDPGATVDVCRGQDAPAARGVEAQKASGAGELPTEVGSKPAEPPPSVPIRAAPGKDGLSPGRTP